MTLPPETITRIKAKVEEVRKYSVTAPPYRVEVGHPTYPTYYVSGQHCNAGFGFYFAREDAQVVCDVANEACSL